MGVHVIWHQWDPVKEIPVKRDWYCHQLVVGGKKQDSLAALSTFEVMMIGLQKDHPQITGIHLCTLPAVPALV